MSRMSPTARSVELLQSEDWLVDVVERRITSIITKDLFGMFDLIAVRDATTLAVQVTTSPNLAARCRKIADSPHIAAVRTAGWQVEVHGWRDDGRRWRVTRRDLS